MAVAAVEGSAAVSAAYSPEGFAVAFVDIVLAYLCWTGRRWAFLVAVVVALLAAVGAFPFPPQVRAVGTPFDAAIDALLVLVSLLVLIFGISAYQESSPRPPR